ncbi:MAG: type II secretion system minor pseudopilin GspI [Kangiellaceae bacterium]|nr:type II secretion system minor pseudopilin GspI [Kangiellaceae bacterium]
MQLTRSKKSKAFTLLEVLVAMAIFGYAAVSLISNMSQYQRMQLTATQRTVAHWVAMNQMAESRLEKEWPNVGVTRGTADMVGKTWYWKRSVSKTTEKELRQVEIEIRLEQNDELATTRFVGFIANKAIKKT